MDDGGFTTKGVTLHFSTHALGKSALLAYLSLIAWVIAWHGFLSPHPQVNYIGVTIGWVFPLLFPLKGIIKANPYTHAWANFILMLYFLHALTILWTDPSERLFAAIELLITSIAFTANVLFAKQQGKIEGVGLQKLSEVERLEKAKFEQTH